MLLPCPHCKRRFQFPAERFPGSAVKVKCPACSGHFVVDTAPIRRIQDPVPARPLRDPPPAPAMEKRPPSVTEGREAPVRGSLRAGRRSRTVLWVLLPVSGLLLASLGSLTLALWRTPTAGIEQPGLGEPSASHARQSPVSVKTSKQGSQEEAPPDTAGQNGAAARETLASDYRSLWPFAHAGQQESCEHLARFPGKDVQEETPDRCSLYSTWIAYMSLETLSRPACNLETVFGKATEEVAKGRLCGRGYAFLAAYYSYKRVLNRSRSFLEQALLLSPKDPWVRLVEAVVHLRDLRDSEKAVRILSDLVRRDRSFSLAQYHLAKIYIAEEEYDKAHELFLLLEEAFPQQPAFMRIRQSLASMEQVPYYSVEGAKGLLTVGRALSDLMDYPLAGKLCRKVLEDMKETLPRAEQKSAFYDLGRISEITGDKETAFACYQNALRIDPFYRDARERMGGILKSGPQTS